MNQPIALARGKPSALSSRRVDRFRPDFHFRYLPIGHHLTFGWTWGQGHSHYLTMIIGVYATLGVFLLLASRTPDAYTSVIWFTVWSRAVHGGIMSIQSIIDESERGHLLGDVPAIFLIAIILGVLAPRHIKENQAAARI
jgi:hypothetical protein